MTFREFADFHKTKSANSSIFNSPEEFASTEKRVTDADIKNVEKNLGCKLPESYIHFCKEYGGGYFGFTIIHSLDENGEWFIGNVMKEFSYYLPKDLIPFSDDQCGGFYCFKVNNQLITESIYYIDSAGLIEKCSYPDFFYFLIDHAYPK